MTNYVVVKVLNRVSNKVLYERDLTSIPLNEIPYNEMVTTFLCLYASFEVSVIFEVSQIDKIPTHG